eukprot:TRINITY_DN7925_c0_g1_i7.p1 TRINITY_DN7925_c0_g1~~TRINITY_DN7925_c0_g1_i7.p1  ORF type:complete len:222 (+),score=5.91 TRINITY_DN7925_c0_g1_i7:1625-2290(+)
MQSRINNVTYWPQKLQNKAPISHLAVEQNKFDTQKMQNPELSGKKYQHGTFQDCKARQYLLIKWEHNCAYCDAKGVPLPIAKQSANTSCLQVEPSEARFELRSEPKQSFTLAVVPKSKGDEVELKRSFSSGSDRVNNLVMAYAKCNQNKGVKSIQEFLASEAKPPRGTSFRKKPDRLAYILAQLLKPLKNVALMNSLRKHIVKLQQRVLVPRFRRTCIKMC